MTLLKNMTGRIIVLEGLPGAGKTLLSSSLCNYDENVIVLEEWVDEEVLAKYISDMKRYATNFQFRIQNETMERMRKAVKLAKEGFTVLVDRGITGNRCFAEMQYENGLISSSDIETYRRAFNYEMIAGLSDVNLHVIYMKASVSTCLDRIKKRDRKGESSYSVDYLKSLCNKHDELLPTAKIFDADEEHVVENGVLSGDVLRRSLEAY